MTCGAARQVLDCHGKVLQTGPAPATFPSGVGPSKYMVPRVCSCFDRMDHGNSTYCMHPPRGVRFTVYTIQQNRWSPIGPQQATTRCLLDASDHAGARGGAT